jgi:chemotaxis protein MotB
VSRKKPEEAQEEGSPAWMNTYGDMVTLLLTFFVLLFSFSTIDAKKWEEIVNSFSGITILEIPALDPNAPGEAEGKQKGKFVITSPQPSATPEQLQETGSDVSLKNDHIVVSFNEMYARIKNHIEQNDLEQILTVQYVDEYTVLLRMSDSAFFDSGSDKIKEDVKVVLQDVCAIIKEYEELIKTIRVEGHTDTVPMKSAEFVDNWDLSTARAEKVVRFTIKITELNPALFSATGYGEYRPIADNSTDEGKAKNRRVDFVIENILKG